MMDELSLNILDIAQNSIAANASFVEISVEEDDSTDRLIIRVMDNGKGMSEEFLKIVEDPFITTRNTRKIGLGISFLKEAAELTGGSIRLESRLGLGTTITATFQKSHIDRQPIGDLTGTMTALISLNPGIDFGLRYVVNENEFTFTTMDARGVLGDEAQLNDPLVVAFLTEFFREHFENLSGGAK